MSIPIATPVASELRLPRKHLQVGWWSLLAFLSFGILLEALHGFKAGLYLNLSNETRRTLWTLAHAHGTMLALVHLAFAATFHLLRFEEGRTAAFVSACLIGAGILIPAGFFLGGLFVYAGDPGLGILLVPAGAVLLLGAVGTLGWTASRRGLAEPKSVKKKGQPAVK